MAKTPSVKLHLAITDSQIRDSCGWNDRRQYLPCPRFSWETTGDYSVTVMLIWEIMQFDWSSILAMNILLNVFKEKPLFIIKFMLLLAYSISLFLIYLSLTTLGS